MATEDLALSPGAAGDSPPFTFEQLTWLQAKFPSPPGSIEAAAARSHSSTGAGVAGSSSMGTDPTEPSGK